MLVVLDSLKSQGLLLPEEVTVTTDTNRLGSQFNVFTIFSGKYPFHCYQCLKCHKLFTSRSPFENHVHTKETWNYNPKKATNALMDFVCVCNISIDAITR